MDWLAAVTEHVAASCGLDAAALQLTPEDAAMLLDLAGVAAHATGERTNAPLLCHVLGAARARGVALADLDRAVRAFVERV